MKNIFLSLLLIGLVACDNDKENPQLTRLKVYQNATVSEDFPFVESGNSLVFHYFYEASESEYIADDEFAEDFFIVISANEDEFSMTTEDLQETAQTYLQYCFCLPLDFSNVTSGEVTGVKKPNGDWKVTGSITLQLGTINDETQEMENEYEKELSLSGTYQLSDIPN